MIREFDEELGLQVDVVGDLLIFENIYQHQGFTRHEVAFVAEIRLPDGALTADGPVIFNRITDSSVAQFGMICGWWFAAVRPYSLPV